MGSATRIYRQLKGWLRFSVGGHLFLQCVRRVTTTHYCCSDHKCFYPNGGGLFQDDSAHNQAVLSSSKYFNEDENYVNYKALHSADLIQ